MTTTVGTTEQVYELFIKATPEQVWEGITSPEFTTKYFYGSRIEVTPERRLSLSPPPVSRPRSSLVRPHRYRPTSRLSGSNAEKERRREPLRGTERAATGLPGRRVL